MHVSGTAFVELYVADHETAIAYFARRYGFTEAARWDDDEGRSTFLSQGAARLVVTSGPMTRRSLAEHGDAVVDIALECDDVERVRDQALAAGGRLIGPTTVSGAGSLVHTLVPRRAEHEPGYPAGRTWVAVPHGADGATAPARHVRGIDHFALCVEAGSLDKTADYYEAFGLGRFRSEHVAVAEQAMDSVVVRNDEGTVTFTVLAPDATRAPGQIDAFLQRNGAAGIQHIAFLVDDIVAAVREIRSRGVEFLHTPAVYYDLLAERLGGLPEPIRELRDTDVLADRDEWGVLFQIFSKSPYARGTLFYELIQRRGAQGFGSANIRALYDAVERGQ